MECYSIRGTLQLVINNNIYEVHANQYVYQDEEAGLLEVTLQGIYPIGETVVSNTLYVEHELQETTLLFQYSKHSIQDIQIVNLDLVDFVVFDEMKTKIENIEIVINQNSLEILSTYIKETDTNKVILYLYEGNRKIKLVITIHDKDEPYLISSSSVKTDIYEDIVFQFELFDGFIKQIYGQDLSESDYTVSGNILTIKSEYILRQYENQQPISITYTLEQDHIVFGFLVIDLDLND